ncbi:MAG: ROK family protein [Parvularcula sp.]
MMTDALSLALMDFSGTVIEQQQFDMVTMTRASVIERLETLFTEFLEKHEIDESRLLGIGVGISGYSLGTHGRYNTPRTLDDWALVDIEELLQEQFGHPVWVENDGNAAAIGESLVGAGRSYNNFGYVFFSTGIGGGIVYEHELMRGTNGNAGELGLLLPRAVYPHPNLELLRNIVAQSGIEVTGISDLLNKFDPDWPAVDEWIARSRDSLSLIASSLAAILDPEAIVMGGRIPKSLARKVIPHIEIFNDARRSEPRQVPRLMVSETEGDACAIGAAALPFNGCYFKVS